MIDKDVIIATLLILGTLANILYTHTRTRGAVTTLKAQEEVDDAKARSALEDKRLEVWSEMVRALSKISDRVDSVMSDQKQANQIATQSVEVQEKTVIELREQGDTLDTLSGLATGIDVALEQHRKTVAPGIEAAVETKQIVADVRDKVADLGRALETLPAEVGKGIAEKFDAIEGDIRALTEKVETAKQELLDAIKGLRPAAPEPSFVAAIVVPSSASPDIPTHLPEAPLVAAVTPHVPS